MLLERVPSAKTLAAAIAVVFTADVASRRFPVLRSHMPQEYVLSSKSFFASLTYEPWLVKLVRGANVVFKILLSRKEPRTIGAKNGPSFGNRINTLTGLLAGI